MPFGLVMFQDVFMQRMDMILEKCPGTIGLIDDVYRKTKEEHDSNLRNLMRIARTEGLCFNSEKCVIDKKKKINKFLCAIYDKNGIRPDPNKVEAMKQLPRPTNITDLQKVLGIITYLAPFIPHRSDLTAPITDLLKKEPEY